MTDSVNHPKHYLGQPPEHIEHPILNLILPEEQANAN
jgi:hypothetical protein